MRNPYHCAPMQAFGPILFLLNAGKLEAGL
jgi:hypothetical protein